MAERSRRRGGIFVGHDLDPLDYQTGVAPEHHHLAGRRGAAGNIDEQAIAFAELGLHRVALYPEDTQVFRARAALVVEHGLEQIPSGPFRLRLPR